MTVSGTPCAVSTDSQTGFRVITWRVGIENKIRNLLIVQMYSVLKFLAILLMKGKSIFPSFSVIAHLEKLFLHILSAFSK